jgi:asparagine synthase (glutamine-hydrolysing)
MTMGASIECRVPFLDYRLVEGLASLSTSTLLDGDRRLTKNLLRRSIGNRLPQRTIGHRKWGFGVPWSQYLRKVKDLCTLVNDLPDLEPVASGPLDRSRVRRLVDNFIRGDREHEELIRQLVMIAIWYRTCIADTPLNHMHRPTTLLSQ